MVRELPSRRPCRLVPEGRAGDPESPRPEFRGKGRGRARSGHRRSLDGSRGIDGPRVRLPRTWIDGKKFWPRKEARPFGRKTEGDLRPTLRLSAGKGMGAREGRPKEPYFYCAKRFARLAT